MWPLWETTGADDAGGGSLADAIECSVEAVRYEFPPPSAFLEASLS